MNKTIEVRLEYSISGWYKYEGTKTIPDKLEYQIETNTNKKVLDKKLKDRFEFHKKYWINDTLKDFKKQYHIKRGWKFSIWSYNDCNLSTWHKFEIQSPWYKPDFNKLADKTGLEPNMAFNIF